MQPILDRPSAADSGRHARPFDGRILASLEDARPRRGLGSRWLAAGAGAAAVLAIAVSVLARMQAPAVPRPAQAAMPALPAETVAIAAPPAEIAMPEPPAASGAGQVTQAVPVDQRAAAAASPAARPAGRKRKPAKPLPAQRAAASAPAEAADHDVAVLAAIIAYGRSAVAGKPSSAPRP